MFFLSKRAASFILITIFLLYITYHIISGKRGIIALLDIDRAIKKRQSVIMDLGKQRSQLESKLLLLDQEAPDLDYIDELKRSQSGLTLPEEITIILEDGDNK